MLLPLTRLVLLVVLHLTVLTNAIPVVQDGFEIALRSELFGDETHESVTDIRARSKKSRPVKSKPKPKPAPKPVKTSVRKPKPVKTIIKKPTPTKKPVVVHPTTKPTRVPVPKSTLRPTHASVPPHSAPKPTTPVGRPSTKPATPIGRPPTRPTTPVGKPTAPSHATKTTGKPTASKTPVPTNPPQCQLPSRKPTKRPRAVVDWVISLFKRDSAEFIGWHGTNSDTAELWEKKGYLADPKASGWPWSSGGRSGADHELGEGVYITDEMETARGFANNNAAVNKGTTAKLCGIFARSQNHWRSAVNKVWLPNAVIRDSSNEALHLTYEKQRDEWIARVIPHSTGKDVARFAPLDKNRDGGPNQVVLPSALTSQVYAVCVDAGSAQLPLGANEHINYHTERQVWNVRDTPCA